MRWIPPGRPPEYRPSSDSWIDSHRDRRVFANGADSETQLVECNGTKRDRVGGNGSVRKDERRERDARLCEGACGSLAVGERAGEHEAEAWSTSVEIVSERRLQVPVHDAANHHKVLARLHVAHTRTRAALPATCAQREHSTRWRVRAEQTRRELRASFSNADSQHRRGAFENWRWREKNTRTNGCARYRYRESNAHIKVRVKIRSTC